MHKINNKIYKEILFDYTSDYSNVSEMRSKSTAIFFIILSMKGNIVDSTIIVRNYGTLYPPYRMVREIKLGNVIKLQYGKATRYEVQKNTTLYRTVLPALPVRDSYC